MLFCGIVYKILKRYWQLVITRWHSLQENYEHSKVCSEKSGISHMSTSLCNSAFWKVIEVKYNQTSATFIVFLDFNTELGIY